MKKPVFYFLLETVYNCLSKKQKMSHRRSIMFLKSDFKIYLMTASNVASQGNPAATFKLVKNAE